MYRSRKTMTASLSTPVAPSYYAAPAHRNVRDTQSSACYCPTMSYATSATPAAPYASARKFTRSVGQGRSSLSAAAAAHGSASTLRASTPPSGPAHWRRNSASTRRAASGGEGDFLLSLSQTLRPYLAPFETLPSLCLALLRSIIPLLTVVLSEASQKCCLMLVHNPRDRGCRNRSKWVRIDIFCSF